MIRVLTRAAILAIGLSATTSAPADASTTRPATCDEAPGATIARSADWRVFWAARVPKNNPTGEGLRLYACERGARPLTRVRVLGSADDPYGTFEVPRIVGDIAQLEAPTRGGTYGRLIDLRRGRTAPGNVAFTSSCQDSPDGGTHVALLPDGSVASAPFASTPPDACGPRYTPGALTIRGAGGPTTVAPAAQALAPSLGADGRSSGVYYMDATGRAARAAGAGPASDLAWQPTPSLKWQSRSFRLRPNRSSITFLSADGTSSYAVLRTPRGAGRPGSTELTVDIRPDVYAHDRRTYRLARLAPGSARAARVIASGGFGLALVAARFADAPTTQRLRLYGRSDAEEQTPYLDLPVPGSGDAPEAVITRSRALVLTTKTGLEWWRLDQMRGDRYSLAATFPSTNASDLAVAGDTVYFTDATGVHKLQSSSQGLISLD